MITILISVNREDIFETVSRKRRVIKQAKAEIIKWSVGTASPRITS